MICTGCGRDSRSGYMVENRFYCTSCEHSKEWYHAMLRQPVQSGKEAQEDARLDAADQRRGVCDA